LDFKKGRISQGMSKDSRKEYSDIIDRPHHVSSKRPQMSKLNRSAQFSPFAALTGYDALVDESARVTDERLELLEDGMECIDMKLQLLQSHLADNPVISVLYFEKDRRKAGGAYVEAVGTVKKIDKINSVLLMQSGEEIPLDNIYDLYSALFDSLSNIV